MVEETVIKSVKSYLARLSAAGIHANKAVLFGSFARGQADAYSDIDLVVIAPEFDGSREMVLVKKLWRATQGDSRIEPIPCGEHEIARREGVIIAA